MTSGTAQPKPRANIYVDGFNLYYGALKNTPHKWLNLDALFQAVLPGYEIQRIRYFSARISGRVGNTQAPTRQATYLRALRTLPNVTIHLGHFLTSEVSMPLVQPPATGPKTVKVIKTEEKGSDVNLATYLIIDAMRGDCDVAAVVSNDSDLCEPIRIVQQELQMPVGCSTRIVGLARHFSGSDPRSSGRSGRVRCQQASSLPA